MEYTVHYEPCGCKVWRLGENKYRIEYCPKHASAQALYEACKVALAGLNTAGETGWLGKQLREALAKAEERR